MITLKLEPGLSAGDEPAFDDQSSSRYARFGDVQICWGVAGSNSSGGTRFNTFPANFKDANYNLTATVNSGTTGRNLVSKGKQTNGFYTQSYDTQNGGRSNQGGYYIAVGKWR